MATDADAIKNRLDIVEFVGSYVTLKKAGRNFKAICPFHMEKTPSFVVSPDRQTWHCFGSCHDGGDAIKFYMRWENVSFVEALKELAKKTGVVLKKMTFEDSEWKQKERMIAANTLAEEYFHFILTKHKLGKPALDYINGRGISTKMIETFKLGYSPNSWDSLLSFMKKRKYNEKELQDVGLAVLSSGGRVYDRFRGRLMFPLKDPRGNTIGFSGRILTGQQEAKYVNTPETAIYHKRETLFGINITRDAIRKKEQAILVEGEFDLLSLFREGFSNVVAIKGSAVTSEQLVLLKRFANKLVFALDADAAGIDTTIKAVGEAEKMDFEVSVVVFENGKDPDEALKNNLVASKKALHNPVAIYDYVIDTALKKYPDNDAFAKKNIGNAVVPFIAKIHNPIVKSHYIGKIAALLEVDPRSVESLVHKEHSLVNRGKPVQKTTQTKNAIQRINLLEQYILGSLFQSSAPDKIYKEITKVLDKDDFSIPAYQKLVEHFVRFETKTGGTFSQEWVKEFVAGLPQELVRIFDEVYLFDAAIFDEKLEDENFARVLYELKKTILKEQIKKEMNMLKEDTGSDTLNQLLHNLSQVEKKLSIL